MNIERALSVFESVFEELNSGTVSTFQSLLAALSGQISQPQNPSYQQQVSTHLINLKKILLEAPSNNYSPVWRQTIQELNFEKYLGTHLLTEIESIFEKNSITLIVAQQELQKLSNTVSAIKENLSQMIQAAKKLELKNEELQPGKCELGYIIPRETIKNNLPQLIKELKEAEQIFLIFEEIVTNSRTELQLSSISSSDPSFFFDTLPKTAACVAFTIERIIALYKNYLEIKKLQQDMIDRGVNKKALAAVQEQVNSEVEEGIKKLAPEIIKEYCNKIADAPRRHELTTELTKRLNKLAYKIDRGLRIEIRANPLTENADQQETTEQKEEKVFLNFVYQKVPTINYIKPSGEPILYLPDNDNQEDHEEKKHEGSNNPQTIKKSIKKEK
jgi:regulator of replication initiation timing